MKRTTKSHLKRAVAICGTQKKLGAAIGRSQQYVSWLLNRAPEVPGKVAIAIEKATQGSVTKSQLCPDFWPADTARGPGSEPSEQAA